MKIAFVVPELDIGGGVSVALAYARYAARSGHEVTVVVADYAGGSRAPLGEGLEISSIREVQHAEFDVVVATWWADILLLPHITARNHAFFLQNPQELQDRMYAHTDPRRRLVKDVFRVPLPGITIAKWLQKQFLSEFGRTLPVVENGIDKAVFRADGSVIAPPRPSRLRVLVEGPLGVEYKNVVESLRVSRAISDETWLLTSTAVGSISGIDRVCSRYGRQDAAAVYRSCDVLIKLSTVEGLALPPLEMFHCGGTVVAFDIPGIAAYAEHGRNALLVPTARFQEAAEQLAQLQRDQDLLDGLRAGARETARAWPSEDDAGNEFLKELHTIVESHPSTDPDALRELTRISSALAHTEPGTKVRRPSKRLIRSLRYSVEVRMPEKLLAGSQAALKRRRGR